jgi:3-deoxy-D-manno-octulosonate 8-phosphate phosphatase (KDO 8-P phosphatase)
MASPSSSADLADRVRRVELLLLDVDGVLTDGSIVYSDSGEELKAFHVRDGSGLKIWRRAGKRAAIVSGRSSAAVSRRAAELGLDAVFQGRDDKGAAFDELLRLTGLEAGQVCAVGDDLPDLPVLARAGVSVAVADACPEVRAAVDFVTMSPGGRGAAREAVEWLLKLQGRWPTVLAQYRPVE